MVAETTEREPALPNWPYFETPSRSTTAWAESSSTCHLSPGYGYSEQVIARIMANLGIRDDLQVATKAGREDRAEMEHFIAPLLA